MALQAFQNALQLDPSNYAGLQGVCKVYSVLGNHEAELQTLDSLVKVIYLVSFMFVCLCAFLFHLKLTIELNIDINDHLN